jgi:ribonuclease H / adenosylcobalamin/alpha-ribazole phosphatase
MLLAILLTGATLQGPAELGPVPADSVRIYLVRHGQAFSNLDPEPDLPPEQLDALTGLGHAQARAAAVELKGCGITGIYSSPAHRAAETAIDIAQALGMGIHMEPGVAPLKLGRNPKGEEDDWDYRIAEWEAGRDPIPPGGESMQALGERVLTAVLGIAARRAGQSIVVVAHSEVIGAFVGLLQGTPPAKRYPPDIRNGSITAVELKSPTLPTLLFTNYLRPEPVAAK